MITAKSGGSFWLSERVRVALERVPLHLEGVLRAIGGDAIGGGAIGGGAIGGSALEGMHCAIRGGGGVHIHLGESVDVYNLWEGSERRGWSLGRHINYCCNIAGSAELIQLCHELLRCI